MLFPSWPISAHTTIVCIVEILIYLTILWSMDRGGQVEHRKDIDRE